MKSKMKSAFALIAVALMVMVAVVPMIGVFTSDSDAALPADTAVVDPAIDGKITISGLLYSTAATPAATTTATGYHIQVVYATSAGTYTSQTTVTNSNDGWVFYIQETAVSSAIISYVDDEDELVVGYTPVTLSDLVAGSYTANIVPNAASKEIKLVMKNDTTNTITKYLGETSFTATCNVYTSNEETAVPVSQATFGDNGKAIITYPVKATAVYVKVNFQGTSAITFTEAFVNVTSNAYVAANENVISVVPTANITSQLEVDSLTLSDAPLAKISGTMKYSAVAANVVYAYFTTSEAIPTAVTNLKMTVKAPNATSAEYSGTGMSISSGVITFTPTTLVLYGTVSMSTYTQGGSLGMTDINDSSLTPATVGDDGKFITFFGSTQAKIKSMSFTSNTGYTFEVSTVGGSAIPTDGYGPTGTNVAVALKADDYSAVTGNLYYKVGTADTAIVGKSIAATGAGVVVFGNTVTTTGGAFGFMATKNTDAIIKPTDSIVYTGDIERTVGVNSTGLKIYMETQEVSISVTDALGKELTTNVTAKLIDEDETVMATLANATSSNVYTATIRKDLTPALWFVDLTYTSGTYTFDEGQAYVAEATYAANEATYNMTLYSSAGVAKTDITNSMIQVYTAKAYKNSLGSIVYEGVTSKNVTPTLGVFSFVADAAVMAMDESMITTVAQDVVIAIKTANLDAKGIYRPVYILKSTSADLSDEGIVSIKADKDSFTATLTRNDGVTPIAGAKVELDNGSPSPYTAYTQEDGSFTVYSTTLLTPTSGEKLKFTLGNYEFAAAGYALFDDDEEKIVEYTPDKDVYYMIFEDADDAAINVETAQPTITGASYITDTAVKNYAIYKAKWTDETEPVSITLSGRSFAKHTLTEDELSTGLITITSNQKTYTFKSVDANGKAIGNITLNLYKYWGDQAVDTGVDITTAATTTATTTKGVATYRLPLAAPTVTTSDSVSTKYAIVAADATGTYMFSITPEDIDDVIVQAESYYAEIKYSLVDAAGAKILAAPTDATVYKNEAATGFEATITPKETYHEIKFINDPESDYAVSFEAADAGGYSYVDKQVPDDGFLFANEEWIVGDVQNALGVSIGTNTTKIKAYYAAGNVEATYVAEETGYYYSMLVDVDKVKYYQVSALGGISAKYASLTADKYTTPLIIADEMPIAPVLETLNGTAAMPTAYTLTAYNGFGKILDSGATIIVDPELVDEYVLNVTTAGDDYFPVGKYSSDSFVFMSNFVRITGSLPVATSSAADYILIEKYLDDKVVATQIVQFAGANISTYEAFVNMEGYTADVGAVEFDSIYATYVYKGAIYCTTAIDPTSVFNPIVVPGTIVYTVSKIGSALFQKHWDVEVADGVAVLTAEPTFYVADDEAIYTDGQYKYTFAGWFVDGEKVSDAADFSFLIVADAAVSAQYNVTYEKISDANKDVDKEFVNVIEEVDVPVEKTVGIDTNVLIIGICAVIVALIAVVYAVIKKE